MKTFRQRLADGETVRIFAAGRMIHPVMFDAYALAGGFHGFWLDQEHCGLTYEQVMLASVCARANDFDCFVRMAMTNYSQATQNLEAGAGGLMAARVESAAHAEQFMQWVKFAPRGTRGINSGGRDANYGLKSLTQFAADSNRDSFAAIQIETLGALKDVDAIAAIDGVDLLFVGPSDLSIELGIIGQMENPKLWDAMAAVSAACKKHGKHWATLGLTPAFAERAWELNCRMLSFGLDVIHLRKGVEAVKEQYPKCFKSPSEQK